MKDSNFPNFYKWLVGIVATILLAGVLFLGNRLDTTVIIPMLLSIISSYLSLYIIGKIEKKKRAISLLIVSSIGILSLVYLIISDVGLFDDYRGAAWKIILLYGLFQAFRFGYVYRKGHFDT